MGIHFKHFNDVARVALGKVAADFAHLQDEIAGRDTGKRHKHLVSADYTADSVEGGGEDKKRRLTVLDIILMRGSYEEAYKFVAEALASAEIETETAIEAAFQAHEDAKAAHTDIQSRAATLPDGTRVYRDEETGLFHTDDDTLVDPETAADIEWNAHNTTRQENIEARKQVHETGIQLNILRNDRVRLGEIRNEMDALRENEDHDQLKGFKLEIDEISDRTKSYTSEKRSDHKLAHDTDTFTRNSFENKSIPRFKAGG